MRKLLFVPLSLLFGCFAPDLTGTMLMCDSSHFCPDGYSCIAGVCKLGSGGNPTGSDGGSGGSSGCADGMGSDVSASAASPAWACPGTYQASSDTSKNATKLCASGYDLCTAADTVNQNSCNNLGGFFLANVVVRWQNFREECGTAGNNQVAGFAGCGKAIYGSTNIPSCGGFQKGMFEFNNTQLSISSPYSPLATTTKNDSSSNGVLCCKK